MRLKLVLPILSLGVALAACKGEVQIGSKTPEPQPTAAATPAPTPAPTPVEAANPEPKEEPKVVGVGRIRQEGDHLAVPGNIEFDSGKAVIKMTDKETKELIESLLELMQKNPTLKIKIIGHTDNEGGAAYNMKLSDQRAAAVAKWLADKGIAADRLATEGHGQDKPLCANDTAARKKANRRTEFVIMELNGAAVPHDPNHQPKCED
jgi:outer membrane protein OmpA-like peptidoglycan-associated protein